MEPVRKVPAAVKKISNLRYRQLHNLNSVIPDSEWQSFLFYLVWHPKKL